MQPLSKIFTEARSETESGKEECVEGAFTAGGI